VDDFQIEKPYRLGYDFFSFFQGIRIWLLLMNVELFLEVHQFSVFFFHR